MGEKIRYAVVGLGHIAQVAVLPGFKHAKNSELVGLVSGDNVKLKKLAPKYKVKNVCGYDGYDKLLRSGEIDAVYICTPNTLHSTFAERAADCGIHILCEKPLATTEDECVRIIKSSFKNNVKLMVAYRLHFNPANLKAIELAQSDTIGEPRLFNSVFSYDISDRKNIRLQESLGGGAVYDIGIYCINAARYIFQAEPLEVFAFQSTNELDDRFNEVPEMWTCLLKFSDDRLAQFAVSFGMTTSSYYEVIGTKGKLRLENAYEYTTPMELHLTVNEKRQRSLRFPKQDQFGPEIEYFSRCILNNLQPEPSGIEGLADIRVIEALKRSSLIGVSRQIESVHKNQYPSQEQGIAKPGVQPPQTIHAVSPSGG